jgi:hypothetical protein
MNALADFRGEERARAERDALARLVALAPRVFPAVRIEDDWKAALEEARQVLQKRGQG